MIRSPHRPADHRRNRRGRSLGAALSGLSVLALVLPGSAAATIPSFSWQEVAPSVSQTPIHGPSGLAGRVSAIVALPGRVPTQVAGTLGGLWLKTGNRRWRNVTNHGWPSTSIGALTVDPRTPPSSTPAPATT